jgi:hypothetical protein
MIEDHNEKVEQYNRQLDEYEAKLGRYNAIVRGGQYPGNASRRGGR